MVSSLSDEYAETDKPVVFFEQNVDNRIDTTRYSRWWAAHDNSGSVILPLVMVDSGHQYSFGKEDYRTIYKAMVNSALTRPPGAKISAMVTRLGESLHFRVEITNYSGISLSISNNANVYAIIYEENTVNGLTGNYLVATSSTPISPPLSGSSSAIFNLQTVELSGVNWDKMHPIVFIDYRPEGSSKYDMLQAAFETDKETFEIGNKFTPAVMMLLLD